MRFESSAEAVLLEHAGAAFGAAVADVVDEARDRARVKTGRFRDSIESRPVTVAGDRLESRVGSPLASARAKELGAFVRPRPPATIMHIPFGGDDFATVDAFRIPATPAVQPAGRQFPRFMEERLRGTPLSGRGDRSRPIEPDFRSGRVEVR